MNLALFDFDGTITDKDCFTDFIYYATSTRRLALGMVVLSPYILSYKIGVLSERTMRAKLCGFVFRGKPAADIHQKGLDFVHTLNPVLRPHALARIAWHKAQGDQIVVVSSSLAPYLEDWCRQMDVALICNQLESKQGRLTGRLIEGDCGGVEKARRIRERYALQDYVTIYAYGDSANDHAMLALANKRFYQWQEVSATT